MTSRILSALTALAIAAAVAQPASAACVNKFLRRNEGMRQIVTLLTGKMTFQEAQTLAAAISKKTSPALEWVDDKGKSIAKQYGDLRVVRPMPVGCDGKSSGVIVVATFLSSQPPKGKMIVKLSDGSTVLFEEQAE